MKKTLHVPNDHVSVDFSETTISVFYSPSEDLSILDFLSLYEEFLKIKARYEAFQEASRPR